ncbi:MAG: Ig-like domain-containing protein [Mogibacterium sp.]|nr:Ig-like domain-containing protein [Mogibacterium sp.]
MKKIVTLSVMLCLIAMSFCITITSYADDVVYIKNIEVYIGEPYPGSHPPAIGDSAAVFTTKVTMSDDTIATEDKYKAMSWKIERYDNVSKTYTTVATGEGEKMEFWQPYGTPEGQYKVTATSKADPHAFGYTWHQQYYPWYTETFCIFRPGTVKDGEITTITGDTANPQENAIKAKDIKETYNWDTKKYTCILPECPYRADDYTFIGWKKDEKIYQPGDIYVAGYEDEPDGRNAYFEAQWKPNFKKPDVVANKVGSSKIKLRWNRMIGGKGYKIYRSTKKNGKYKLVKTIKNKKTISWTDKSVKRGETYYYKVAAYKKSKQHKSAWVQASTKAAKVKSVKLSPNQDTLRGVVGGSAALKAKVKARGGKVLSKKVRWYTSNAAVAKVDEKTGKVTFVSAGNCQIWAKAYNGKNSEKISVVVTAP